MQSRQYSTFSKLKRENLSEPGTLTASAIPYSREVEHLRKSGKTEEEKKLNEPVNLKQS